MPKWEFQPHQIVGAQWGLAQLRRLGWAYFAWEERTRKTGTLLYVAEKSLATGCLIITTKKALPGWEEHLHNLPLSKKYYLLNYDKFNRREIANGRKESMNSAIERIKNSYHIEDYDMVILDEAHTNISSIGRPTDRQKLVKIMCNGKAILYASATPYAEHIGLLYHQLWMSSWSPLRKFGNFYDFYRRFGIPDMVQTPYGLKDTRRKYKTNEVLELVEDGFSFKTRRELGFEHEASVNLVKVKLHDETIKLIENWKELNYLECGNGHTLLGDTDSKKRVVHYQLESGTLKLNNDQSLRLKQHEKLDHCLANYDKEKTAIMCHFVEERKMYAEAGFDVYSADGHAEGVNLSHIEKLVVTSMSFRTSKFQQRLSRQADMDRRLPIVVDILVCDKPAIGMAVYETVALKRENFIKNSYELAIK